MNVSLPHVSRKFLILSGSILLLTFLLILGYLIYQREKTKKLFEKMPYVTHEGPFIYYTEDTQKKIPQTVFGTITKRQDNIVTVFYGNTSVRILINDGASIRDEKSLTEPTVDAGVTKEELGVGDTASFGILRESTDKTKFDFSAASVLIGKVPVVMGGYRNYE